MWTEIDEVNDFLIEYDLTDDQKSWARRLKEEAQLKQLMKSLAEHALFFGGSKRPKKEGLRGLVLPWFSSLSVSQRVGVLTVDTACVRTLLKMRHLRGPLSRREGRFLVHSAERGEPKVQYRRAYRLPDGEVLYPPASEDHLVSCNSLLRGLQVSFRNSGSKPLEWGTIEPSWQLVRDVKAFASMMDGISLGQFLTKVVPDAGRVDLPWLQTHWLQQWGGHFPLAAFIASKLEVLLWRGYLSRDLTLNTMSNFSLVDVWGSMSREEREDSMRQINARMVREFCCAALAACREESWQAPQRESSMLVHALQDHLPMADVHSCPLGFVQAATTVSFTAAGRASNTSKNLVQRMPWVWSHHRLALEFAVACSEHSASTLVRDDDPPKANKRREKKQRQKMKRRQAASLRAERAREEESADVECDEELEAEPSEELPGSVVHDDNDLLMVVEHGVWEDNTESTHPLHAHVEKEEDRRESSRERDLNSEREEPAGLPHSFLGPHPGVDFYDDSWDRASELSSIGPSHSAHGHSAHDGLRLPPLAYYSFLDNKLAAGLLRRRKPRRNAPKWHDDSRLEFLLRNRDRFSTEMEWDLMSHSSVPASLDEGVLYPVGLESRFAYLFDSSPTHSCVQSGQLSQATAEDDAERLSAPWGDFDEWRSLTQTLEKTEGELQSWKSKAEELEEELASVHPRVMTRLTLRSDGLTSADRTPPVPPSPQPSLRDTLQDASANPTLAWRYLVLLVLAYRQLDNQRLLGRAQRADQIAEFQLRDDQFGDRRYSLPCGRDDDTPRPIPALGPTQPRPSVGSVVLVACAREPAGEARKRALHATFGARTKRNLNDAATQTAPAITLSKMYGDMVPRFTQRELNRLRQENQILRYRCASLAMSLPLGRPPPMRHQATQTGPTITFSTARQQASFPGLPDYPELDMSVGGLGSGGGRRR